MFHESPCYSNFLREEALNGWSSDNASTYWINGYLDPIDFDNLDAQNLIVGSDNIRKYSGTVFTELPAHKYEMIELKVGIYGETDVLPYQHQPTVLDGIAATKRAAKVVFFLFGDLLENGACLLDNVNGSSPVIFLYTTK